MIVVPSDAQQAALAALVEFDPADEAARQTPSGSRSVLAGIRVGAVAPAARDDAEGRFMRGDSVGFAGDEIVAWGGAGLDPGRDGRGARRRRRDRHRDRGRRGADRARASSALPLPDGAELELHDGGTANYSWLIAAQ